MWTPSEEYSSRNTALPDEQPHANGTPVKEIVAVDTPPQKERDDFSDGDELAIFSRYAEELEAYTDGQEVIAFDVPTHPSYCC